MVFRMLPGRLFLLQEYENGKSPHRQKTAKWPAHSRRRMQYQRKSMPAQPIADYANIDKYLYELADSQALPGIQTGR